MKHTVRLELRDGTVKWRAFPQLDDCPGGALHHATLCHAFGLDPIRTTFDLPSSVRGIGSASGDQTRGPRIRNGYVMWPTQGARNEKDREPIGILTFVREGEKIPDIDIRDQSDFYSLNRRIA